jgi:hypothetical protein
VVAIVDDASNQIEQARYLAYGIPDGLPAGDLDSDGDCDAADVTIFDGLGGGGSYDVRADLNLDGDNDSGDRGEIVRLSGSALGYGALSLAGVGSRKGYAGYELAAELSGARTTCHVRQRSLDVSIGRWMTRPTIGFPGRNQYRYGFGNPCAVSSPHGQSRSCQGPLCVDVGPVVEVVPHPSLGVGEGCECGPEDGCQLVYTPNEQRYAIGYHPETSRATGSTFDGPPMSPSEIEAARCACICWATQQDMCGETEWLIGLPDCPCYLDLDPFGEPINPNPDIWHDPSAGDVTFHPGAMWCMRSDVANMTATSCLPGQQCCYDKTGRLIRDGEGAGTPDRSSPDFPPLECWWRHMLYDVFPFIDCRDAGLLRLYWKFRPPNSPPECTI